MAARLEAAYKHIGKLRELLKNYGNRESRGATMDK